MSWLKALTSEADKENSDALIGVTDAPPAPALFDGSLSAAGGGVPRGLIEARAAFQTSVNAATGFMMSKQDQIAIEDAATENFQKAAEFAPDPTTTGAAANLLHEVNRIVPRTAAGGALAGPAGAFVAAGAPSGIVAAQDLKAQGVDDDTANTAGIIQGAVMGVGAVLPAANILKGVVADTGAVVGANVALGVANRAATHEILDGAGYGVQAEQYKAFDAESMIIDGTLGAAFKGVDLAVGNRPTTAQVDAALTTKSERARTESGPGIPATSKAADLHIKESDNALEAVLAGQPVRVSEAIVDAEFVRHAGTVPANVIDLPEPVLEGATMGARDSVVGMIVGLESGGKANAKNPLSSATGAGQFTNSTWLSMVNKHRPDLAQGKTKQQILDLRNDGALSREMVGNLIDDNAAQLRGYGIKNPSAMDLYLAHHFGAGRVPKMRSNPGELMDNVITAAEMKANPTYRGKTVAQIVAKFERRAQKQGADVQATFEPVAARDVAVTEINALPNLPEPTRQGLADAYTKAAEVKPKFDSIVEQIADDIATGHNPLIPNTLKGIDRATEKVMADYGGDASRLRDLVRATIVVDDISQVQGAIDAAMKRLGATSKQRNTLNIDAMPTSPDGYRDALLNFTIDGHTVELQVNHPAMLKAKKDAHDMYEARRSMDAKVESENRSYTQKELAERDRLNSEMKKRYDSAWSEATKARNVDSSITSPWSNDDSLNLRGSSLSQAKHSPVSLLSDAGTPSKSTNSVPAGNLSGNAIDSTSGRSITDSQSGGKVNAELSQSLAEAEQAIAELPTLAVLDGFDADGNPVSRSAADVLADARAEHLRDTQEAEFAPAAIACFRMKGA